MVLGVKWSGGAPCSPHSCACCTASRWRRVTQQAARSRRTALKVGSAQPHACRHGKKAQKAEEDESEEDEDSMSDSDEEGKDEEDHGELGPPRMHYRWAGGDLKAAASVYCLERLPACLRLGCCPACPVLAHHARWLSPVPLLHRRACSEVAAAAPSLKEGNHSVLTPLLPGW